MMLIADGTHEGPPLVPRPLFKDNVATEAGMAVPNKVLVIVDSTILVVPSIVAVEELFTA